jgi:hypothetical protein
VSNTESFKVFFGAKPESFSGRKKAKFYGAGKTNCDKMITYWNR